MNKFFRMAALAAAVIVVGLINPADAKPKHKHKHAKRHHRGPDYRYSGASMGPHGWTGYGPAHGWYGGERPPGWSRGAKRGWNGRHMPPGQYRKYHR